MTKTQKRFVPVYLFRRRGWGATDTPASSTESTGLYFITEASSNASPNYIITE